MTQRLACILVLAALCGAVTPASAVLYGLVDTGEIFASVDDGQAWAVRGAVPASDAVALVTLISPARLLLTTSTGSIYRSVDDGFNWNAVGLSPLGDVVDLAVARNGSVALLTASGAVYTSADDGVNWAPQGRIPASDCVSIAPLFDGRFFALTQAGSVYASGDGGVTWTADSTVPASDALEIRGLGTAAFPLQGLHVLTATGDLYLRAADGQPFVAVSTLSQIGMAGLALTLNGLAAVTQQGELATTTDATTWNWQGTLDQITVTGLASDLNILTATPSPQATLVLGRPYPNPAGGGVDVRVPVPGYRGPLRLSVFDLRGRRVDQRQLSIEDGRGTLPWNSADLATGSYVLQLEAEDGRWGTSRVSVVR